MRLNTISYARWVYFLFAVVYSLYLYDCIMQKKTSLASIYLVIFLDMLGFGMIIPVLRDYTELLAAFSGFEMQSYAQLAGVLMASYSFFQFLLAPLLGWLSDRVGRKKILVLSVFGNVASYFMWAISESYGFFLLSRIISGATGANISVAQSYIADVTEPQNRSKSMALMGAMFGLGFILGPFFGGLLSDINLAGFSFFGMKFNQFSMIGLVSMGLSIINLIWISGFLVEPERNQSRGLGLKKGIGSIRMLLREPLQPGLGRLYLVYLLSHLGFVHMEATLAWDLQDRFQLDTKHTGYLFAYMGIVMALVQGGIYRFLIKSRGERVLAQYGILLTMLSLFLTPFFSSLPVLLVLVALLALGVGLSGPSITTLASLYSSADKQGADLGFLQSFGSLARIIGPVLATLMYDHIDGSVPFFSGALLLFISLVLSVKLPLKDSKNL